MTVAPDELRAMREPGAWRSFWASFIAVSTKESRWRMRGRRAFVIVTIYLALLSLLVFGVYQLLYEAALAQAAFEGAPVESVSGTVSALIGQTFFVGIVMLQTLLTILLAPALTSGAISLEREKQTLELLITTPISTLGMVAGKLVSSLAYLLLLIVASVPLTSLVFAFGGVAPEDLVRAYLMLFALAFGVGAIGLVMSALIKRTQISTALSYLIVMALTLGSLALHTYILASTTARDGQGLANIPRHQAPEALLWLNPLVANVDLACTALPDSLRFTCSYVSLVTHQEIDAVQTPRDAIWPRSVAAFIALGIGSTLLTTQLIAPSRRLRVRRTPAAEQGADR